MGIEIVIDSLEDMCDLMCQNKIPRSATMNETGKKIIEYAMRSNNNSITQEQDDRRAQLEFAQLLSKNKAIPTGHDSDGD